MIKIKHGFFFNKIVKNRPTEDDYYTRRDNPTTSSRHYPRYSPVYTTQSPRIWYRTTTVPPPIEYDDKDDSDDGYEGYDDVNNNDEDDDDSDYRTEESAGRATFHGDFETVDKHKVNIFKAPVFFFIQIQLSYLINDNSRQ